VECIELNYSPEWPMNMILSNKILLKYRRIFLFANKLEFVSWSLLKAREILNVYKNDTGLQFRKVILDIIICIIFVDIFMYKILMCAFQ